MKRLFIAAITVCFMVSAAQAATISVDFTGTKQDGNGSTDSGTITGTELVGVAAVAEAADNWITAGGASGAGISIDGGGATISYASAFQFDTASAGPASVGQNYIMMDGAIRAGGGGDADPTVAGLGTDYTSNGYRVYVYFGTDAHNRVHRFTITDSDSNTVSLSGLELAGTPYSGTYTETSVDTDRGNYMVFTGLTGSGFSISDNGTAPGKPGIAGIQIVSNPIPEPSSIILILLGTVSLGLIGVRRRKS